MMIEWVVSFVVVVVVVITVVIVVFEAIELNRSTMFETLTLLPLSLFSEKIALKNPRDN